MTPYDEEIMRPKLPTDWLSIGREQSAPPKTSFVDMLKKRLSQPQVKEGSEGMAGGKAAAGGEGGAASL